MTHDKVMTLLAAHADDGLAGVEKQRVEEHIAGCAECAAELRTVRGLLSDVRRMPPDHKDDKDEAFFRDFSRDVRAAYDRAESKGFWAWLRRPALVGGLCAVAAAVLAVMLVRRNATPDPRAAAARPLPAFILDQEDLSNDELERVMAALEAAPDDIPDEETALVPSGGPELSLEGLDDEALQRLDKEL